LEILIFIHEPNNRLSYAFDLIFTQLLKVKYRLCANKEEYLSYQGPKFVYRKAPLDKGLFFYSADLLFETGIKPQTFQAGIHNGLRTIFQNENYGCLPFDPFAASFYLVTRYEEYAQTKLDSFGRFDHNFGVAKRNNFLLVPVVNYYAELVKEKLLQAFPSLEFPELKYSFQPTIDIDNAFAYKHKGANRVLPSILAGFLKLKFKASISKLKVFWGEEQDPYDTYDRQIEIHEKFKLDPIYFFLIGNLSKFDRSISHKNPAFQDVIKKIAAKYRIGSHPSYMSNRKHELFQIEKTRLEEISGKQITLNRQHFLKFSLPHTYQQLIENGIKEDFTMGYSREIGFRASICTPFYFYDLSKEQVTELLVHPFCIMDSTMKYYMKLRSSEVLYTIKPLIEHVKAVKGELVTVFHNESFGSHKVWRNWNDIYEQIMKMATPRR
jgi:hypothetical protein